MISYYGATAAKGGGVPGGVVCFETPMITRGGK